MCMHVSTYVQCNLSQLITLWTKGIVWFTEISRLQRLWCIEVSLYTQVYTHGYVRAYIHMSDVHSITMTYVHVCIHKDECHLIEQTATEIGPEHNVHTHMLVDSEWYLCMPKGRELSCTTTHTSQNNE